MGVESVRMRDRALGNERWRVRDTRLPDWKPKAYKHPLIVTHNWDSPDGTDCLKKAVHSVKLSGMTGAVIGASDAILRTELLGLNRSLGRVAVYAIPFAGVGLTYSVTTCLLGQIRGKSEPLNHAIGGAVAGTCIGLAHNNIGIGAAWAAGSALIMFCYTYYRSKGFETQQAYLPQANSSIGFHERRIGRVHQIVEPTEY